MANFGLSIHDGDLKYTAPDGTEIDVAEAGSGIMCVNFTVDYSGEEIACTVDKTFSEIKAAYDAGKFVYGRIDMGDGYYDSLSLSVIAPDLLGFERMTTSDISEIYLIYAGVSESDGDTVVNFRETGYDLSSLIVEE